MTKEEAIEVLHAPGTGLALWHAERAAEVLDEAGVFEREPEPAKVLALLSKLAANYSGADMHISLNLGHGKPRRPRKRRDE